MSASSRDSKVHKRTPAWEPQHSQNGAMDSECSMCGRHLSAEFETQNCILKYTKNITFRKI